MKHTLLLPPFLILATASFFLVISLGLFLTGVPVPALVGIVAPTLLAAVMPALLVVLSDAVRRVRFPVAAVALMVVVLSAVFVAVTLMATATTRDRALPPPTMPTDVVMQTPDAAFVVGRQMGSDLRDVTLVDRRASVPPLIARHAEAYWDRRDHTLIVPGRADLSLTGSAALTVPIVPGPVATTIDDVYATLHRLTRTPHSAWATILSRFVPGLLPAVALACAAAAVWTVLRLTRWPLLNVVAALGFLRLVIAVPRLVERGSVVNLVSQVLPAGVVAWSTEIAWLVLATTSLIVVIALPSVRQWRHHMHYGDATA